MRGTSPPIANYIEPKANAQYCKLYALIIKLSIPVRTVEMLYAQYIFTYITNIVNVINIL